jgi:hypothetical protein
MSQNGFLRSGTSQWIHTPAERRDCVRLTVRRYAWEQGAPIRTEYSASACFKGGNIGVSVFPEAKRGLPSESTQTGEGGS